ncbi:cupin domain-containing protein [bacterium]|nr:MAG: cupin domain-containing protein [bacterium]
MKLFAATTLSLLVFASVNAHAQQAITITRSGSQPAQKAPSANFTGQVTLDTSFRAKEPGRAGGAKVSFEAGARTNWHTHPLGQTLIITTGIGRVQRWGDPIEEVHPGDVVWIPPGQKHWHGAAPTTAMTHFAIAEQLNGKSVEWLEKVSDEQYGKVLTSPQAAKTVNNETRPNGPTRAQQLMGDLAPKLAELTDEVLLGDVWKRPGLSPRDRSLVTVASLIANGNETQLRSHLALAKANGVTEAELAEVMTHLAFYTGWPRAISAVTIAREVFKK